MRRLCFSALLVLVSLVTLAPAGAVSAPPGESPLHWHDRLAPALAEAAKTHRLVLVDLYADWCTWCKVLDEQVYSTPDFRAKARDFVLARIDVDRDPEGLELQARYSAETLPTMLILDERRVKVGAVEGFRPLVGYLARIDTEIEDYHFLVAAYEKSLADQDVDTWRHLAGQLHGRADGARAAVVYGKLLERGGLDAHGVRWTRYLLADAERLAGQFDAAQTDLAAARQAAAEAHDTDLAERSDLLRFYVAQDRGDCQQAKGALDLFLRDNPRSEYGPAAERALRALQSDAHCA